MFGFPPPVLQVVGDGPVEKVAVVGVDATLRHKLSRVVVVRRVHAASEVETRAAGNCIHVEHLDPFTGVSAQWMLWLVVDAHIAAADRLTTLPTQK